MSRFWIAALAVMLWGSGFGQTPVTFIFDLNGLEASAEGVHIVGDFNGWNKTVDLLSPTGESGIWQIELTLLQYITHSFKFAVNDAYEFAVPDSDCDVLGLFNWVYYNRYLQAGPPGSTIVYSGCFDPCGEPDDLALNCAGECSLDVDNDGVCDALPEVICEDQAACNCGLTGVWLDPCVVALVPGDCAGGAAACGLGMVWNEQAQVCEIAQPWTGISMDALARRIC